MVNNQSRPTSSPPDWGGGIFTVFLVFYNDLAIPLTTALVIPVHHPEHYFLDNALTAQADKRSTHTA